MTRTADHVLLGRADLAGDATDSAHRPPMVERGGPRSDRGGSPLPPTFVAGLLPPFETRPWQLSRPRAPPPPLPLPPPPPRPHPWASAPQHPVPHHPPQKHSPRPKTEQ